MLKIVTNDNNQFHKAHKTDGGYDLIASENVIMKPSGSALVPTGLKVAIPEGFVGIIKSRSGLASKHDIEAGAGVIDCGYTGEVRVLLRNFNTKKNYRIKKGDKIAQMVVLSIYQGEVSLVHNLDETDRGEGGFNSTGYNHE